LIYGYYQLVKKNKKALLFCISWTIIIGSVLIFLMMINGVIPYNLIGRNTMYFGTILEILIFAIALGQNIADINKKQAELNLVLSEQNKELFQLNESLDSFNYHVSHDLKTVLTNAESLGMMAEKYIKLKKFDKVDQILSRLNRVVINGRDTVKSFLSLGKTHDLFINNDFEKFKIEEEVKRVLEDYNLDGSIKVNTKIAELEYFKFNKKAFESVLLNLFTNSIKYTVNSPVATLSWFESKTNFIIEYYDNGIGIDLDKNYDKLFQPFVKDLAEVKKEGSGVGLYLVKLIIENYNGTIKVTIGTEGGLMFRFEFPKTNE
jgi:signal transduction histidine kinase